MTDDNKILISHTEDLISSVKKGRKYSFTSFLNEEQLAMVAALASKIGVYYSIYGGYEDAERSIIGFGADEIPESYVYPISIVTFDLKGDNDITHRHVLGAIMSLGIKRECVGDIVFCDGKCYVFVESKISDFVCINLTSVSRLHIDATVFYGEIQYKKEFEEIMCIVASMRLDCVVSELAKKSRTAAVELIEGGLVYINGFQCLKKDKSVQVGDSLSVRRVGKFRVDSLNGNTKKNRIKLKILKYI